MKKSRMKKEKNITMRIRKKKLKNKTPSPHTHLLNTKKFEKVKVPPVDIEPST